MTTGIEWTDRVWNPVSGCTKISQGCRNCYAFTLHDMRHRAFIEGKKLPVQYAKPFSEIQLFENRLKQPLSWRKPQKVFVNSMSDLFHEEVPDDFIDKVFAVMALSPKQTFQILTKRPNRMSKYLNTPDRDEIIGWIAHEFYEKLGGDYKHISSLITRPGTISNISLQEHPDAWPLPNVWLGVSVENQQAAEERIPYLLETPAAVRFLSCEPLLGEVDLTFTTQAVHPMNEGYGFAAIEGVDWVIVGGESGSNARQMDEGWVLYLRDQCEEYGVPFFFKQWGGRNRKKAGRLLEGKEYNEMPLNINSENLIER